MAFPTFKLFETDGTTLVYEFAKVTNITPTVEDDSIDSVIHQGLRGNGGISVSGSKNTYNTTLTFYLFGQGSTDQEKYISLRDQITTLKTAIPTGTRFILKIDKDLSTTENRNVVRYDPIDIPLGTGQKLLNFAQINMTFATNVF